MSHPEAQHTTDFEHLAAGQTSIDKPPSQLGELNVIVSEHTLTRRRIRTPHRLQHRLRALEWSAGHPAIRAATAALEETYPGEPVLLACIAGTLPATDLFERVLGAKTLFFSFSTADEKLHAPNEFIRVRRLREGMRAWEALWRLLADGPHKLAAVVPPQTQTGQTS